MDIEDLKEKLYQKENMATALGMNFISTQEPEMCMATMMVGKSCRQPFGYLSGGASLALAETLAGVGSSALCPDKKCVGINVSGSHVRAVPEGETVTARARIVHQGKSLHIWNVDITDSSGQLISTASVTNYVLS